MMGAVAVNTLETRDLHLTYGDKSIIEGLNLSIPKGKITVFIGANRRYAHHLVAVKDKTVYAQGKPEDVIHSELVRHVFGMECEVLHDPFYGTPLCIPKGKGRHSDAFRANEPKRETREEHKDELIRI